MENNRKQNIPFMVDVFPAIIKKEYIDISITEKVNSHIQQKTNNFLEIAESSNKDFLAFEKIRLLYEDLLSCDDTANPYLFYYGNALLDDKIEVAKVLSDFRIKMTSYIAFSLHDEHSIKFNNKTMYRKYFVIIFSNTILLFINSCNKPTTFLCALKPNAFNVSFKTKSIERTATIYETSREPIEYYKKFNPVPDSKILSLNWEVTNSDGSRSFRGGLKPENNPLHFNLEYGAITLSICSADLEYGFSNSNLAKRFTETYLEYIGNQKLILADNELKQDELYNTALHTVKKLCKKSLLEKYKSLNPIMQCVLPILLVFGGFTFVAFILFLIEIVTLLLI